MKCNVCGAECVANQKDGRGRAVHLGCQVSLPKEQRNPRLADYPTPTAPTQPPPT